MGGLKIIPAASLTFFLGLTAFVSSAGLDCTEDAMIVFDGSGSMSEMGFDTLDEPRIFEARRAVRRTIPQITPYRRVGLLVYGPGEGDSCSNIDLRFGPRVNAADPIVDAIEALQPDGMTPLSASVKAAAEALEYRTRPGVVVLVTDGKETCGGTPCRLGAQLAAEGADLIVHVIGFKVRGDFFSWDSPEQSGFAEGTVAECLATRTGGRYFPAETVDELAEALNSSLGCAVIGRSTPLFAGPSHT